MPGYRLDSLVSVMDAAVSATTTIGAGENGVVTITATAGTAPNDYTVEVVNGEGVDSALDAAFAAGVITVTLGTDGDELPDDTKNTATLVAVAIDALDDFTAAASGTGATVIAEQSASFSGGRAHFMLLSEVARASVCSDAYIQQLRNGGNCLRHEAERIAAALGTDLTGIGAAPL